MRLVVFSDIHGNATTLRALLQKETNRETHFVFCGDVTGYYYDYEECVHLLKDIKNLTAVRGNHDQYYLDAFHCEELTKKLVKKYGSSYQIKSEYALRYIKDLPLQSRIETERGTIKIQHGAPDNILEGRIYPDSDLIVDGKCSVFLCGHTHYRMCRRDSSLWINPGSLGQPRDGLGFSYCVLDTETQDVSFHVLDVDISGLISKIEKYDPGNRYLQDILFRQVRKK